MGAVKSHYHDLITQQHSLRAITPTSSPTRLSQVHILAYYGEPIGVYASKASAEADLLIMQQGAYLTGADQQDVDAYSVSVHDVYYA